MFRSHSIAPGYLSQRLARREDHHRRGALLGLATLIVLSASPVLGHHVFSRTEVLFAGHDHVMNVCLVALHMLLAPVHGLFHVLLFGGLFWATTSRIRSAVRLRRTLRFVDDVPPSSGSLIAVAASSAGADVARIRVVQGLPQPAFTAGWFRPRIYIAMNLSSHLDSDELTAVIAHEWAHVLRHDPARASFYRFLADTLFYIPALRRLADDIGDEAEIAADDHAAGIADGNPGKVASAIVQLASWNDLAAESSVLRSPAVVGFANDALLERRVRRLLGDDDVPVRSRITRRSVGGAALVLATVWLSGLIMAHPLSAAATSSPESHCQHHHGFPGAHLFCLGHHVAGGHVKCPHAPG